MVRFRFSGHDLFHLLCPFSLRSSSKMKRSMPRLMFILLPLIAIGTTLSYRTIFRRTFGYISLENNAAVRLKLPHPDLNTTLLKYAEIDLGDDQFYREARKLLEADFGDPRRFQYQWSEFRDVNIWLMFHPMFYRLWLQSCELLKDWFQNKGFQPEIISEMINLVKRPIDRYYGLVDIPSRRYSTCAVVGNSGILLRTEYGELIDSHEVVIRLKNARIKGFQQNVGSKTSISFINSDFLHRCARKPDCFCHPYGENIPMVVYTSRPIHFTDYILCNSTHRAPFLVTDARFDVLCARIVKYYSLKRFVDESGKPPEEWGPSHEGIEFHYSSGMQAIMLALGICDSVSIFGFGKSATAKHHYHTNQKKELRLHDYEAEYAFYRDLVKKPQAIPFLMDNFKIPPVVLHL